MGDFKILKYINLVNKKNPQIYNTNMTFLTATFLLKLIE